MSVLVVEGFINITDSTYVQLSRTVKLSEGTGTNPVKDANVRIEGDDSMVYPMQNAGSGKYHTGVLNLNPSRKYRLSIDADGKRYMSDFVEVKVTPPIDSITYRIKPDGIEINANAHDDSNNTRYYKWTYEDAWRFHANAIPAHVITENNIIDNPTPTKYYYCYSPVNKSTEIIVGSTAKLENDVLSQHKVLFIDSASERMQIRYSVLLKQQALTKDAFEYWENMKKNTEQLGSIFDPQPSQITGNIHNLANSEEQVIGYISAGTVETKRIFISRNQLNVKWKATNNLPCELIYIPLDQRFSVYLGQTEIQPYDIYSDGGAVYMRGIRLVCVDCRLRGSLSKPSFWIDN